MTKKILQQNLNKFLINLFIGKILNELQSNFIKLWFWAYEKMRKCIYT